jgi:hypothetical protein
VTTHVASAPHARAGIRAIVTTPVASALHAPLVTRARVGIRATVTTPVASAPHAPLVTRATVTTRVASAPRHLHEPVGLLARMTHVPDTGEIPTVVAMREIATTLVAPNPLGEIATTELRAAMMRPPRVEAQRRGATLRPRRASPVMVRPTRARAKTRRRDASHPEAAGARPGRRRRTSRAVRTQQGPCRRPRA